MAFLEAPNQNATTYVNAATPPVGVSQETISNVAAPNYVNPNQEVTVENRLSNLLEKDNPFLIGARTRAKQQANSLGLMNSTMAATAGEKAAIETALPIAQQDAGYYQQKDLAGQQGEIESCLSGQQSRQQAGLYNVQGQLESQLSGQQAGQASMLSAQEARQAQALQSQKSSQDYDLQTLRGNQEMAIKQADIDWNKIDLEARMQVEYDRMDVDSRNRFDETANVIGSEYSQQLLQILQDPNWPDTQSRNNAIEALNAQTLNRYRIASAAAKADIRWSWGPAAGSRSVSNVQTQPVSDISTQPISKPTVATTNNSRPKGPLP